MKLISNIFSHLQQKLSLRNTAILDKEQTTFFQENGYLVLKEFVSPKEIDLINSLIERLWEESRKAPSKLVTDVFISTEQEARVFLHNAPLGAKVMPHKINDIFLEAKEIRDIILSERLARILCKLMGATPMICNTLNLKFGSQQEFHTDSLYMTPLKKLHLIATWIALEDCSENAGPLVYYPGSHKIKPFLFSHGRMTAVGSEMDLYQKYMHAEVNRLGLKPQKFLPKSGDLLIWHSQLYHGGSNIINKSLTRKSLVTHYYSAKDWAGPKIKLHSHGYSQVRPHQFCSE